MRIKREIKKGTEKRNRWRSRKLNRPTQISNTVTVLSELSLYISTVLRKLEPACIHQSTHPSIREQVVVTQSFVFPSTLNPAAFRWSFIIFISLRLMTFRTAYQGRLPFTLGDIALSSRPWLLVLVLLLCCPKYSTIPRDWSSCNRAGDQRYI